MYMMAWQHQHFYGIRWIYYDDYNNAGFKMEKDKAYAASKIIIQAIVSMVLIGYSLRYFDVDNCYLYAIPMAMSLYHWGIRPSLAFAAGKLTPKELKMASYKHFTLVFFIFMACSLMDTSTESQKKEKIKDRKQIHGLEQESLPLADLCM